MNAWSTAPLTGTLHMFVAWDWGEEVQLDAARRLLPAEPQTLPRRPRTPPSVAYSPPPLLFPLTPLRLDLPVLGQVAAVAKLAVFDFGGASLSLEIPLTATPPQLLEIARALADSRGLVATARTAVEPTFQTLQPAIEHPNWSPLAEEYLVFEIQPASCPLSVEELLRDQSQWLAQLTRLESATLCAAEVGLITQSRLCYTPGDLFLPEWPAALLLDTDCEETLQTIEFANLQLLEYRSLDQLLDARLAEAYRSIHPLTRWRWPFLRTHDQPLRVLGELRVTAHTLFERTGNAFKLMGDQYLARVYRLLAERFHLGEWSHSIQQSLDTVESAYQVVSDQAAVYRIELLEIIVIVLIFIEIVLTLVGH
ncbi:MAG: hypothetical protein SFX18_07975 [Pirellulales bacterium]|nr:hypothetical protein [Pirellulales bacterium]